MWSNSLDKAPLNNACQRGGSWPPGGAQNFTPWCLHVSQCVPQLVNSHTFGCLCRAMGSWGVGLVWDCSHTLHTPMPLGACVAVGQSCQKCGKCVSGVGWLTLANPIICANTSLNGWCLVSKCTPPIIWCMPMLHTWCGLVAQASLKVQ